MGSVGNWEEGWVLVVLVVVPGAADKMLSENLDANAVRGNKHILMGISPDFTVCCRYLGTRTNLSDTEIGSGIE